MLKRELKLERRTLAAALGQATTLDDVIASHKLPWLETPDQAMERGAAEFVRAAAAAGLPPWPVTNVTAVSEEDDDDVEYLG